MNSDQGILKFIGNTPIVELQNVVAENSSKIFVKLESFNPGGSIKTRVAYSMILQAQKEGLLNNDSVLIEPTGGNTGVGLALLCSIFKYKFIAVIPDNFSKERIDILRIMGATVVLSDHTKGNDSHIIKAKELMKENKNYLCLDQFNNRANIEAHYHGTAQEILQSIDGIDAFVASVGSAGTFTGIGSRIRETYPSAKLFLVQPEGCDIMQGKAIKHPIQGVSLGIRPPLLDYSLVENIISVNTDDVKKLSDRLCQEEGLFLGISSVANIHAAIEVGKLLGIGKKVVTVAPDGGQYYLDFYLK